MAAHSNQSGSMCTATLIAPNLLLTARHCISSGPRRDIVCGLSELGEPYPANAIFATNDPVPVEGSRTFQGAELSVPDEGADTCGYDVALVRLSANVPPNVAVPAIPRIDREVEAGEVYTAVGYGADESGEPTGQRQMRSGLSVACAPGLCGFGVESSEFRGETGICSGDSGGPALDAQGKVVGVVSRGGSDCGTPIYGTVTAWREWIRETAARAAEAGGYEPAFWVVTGESDAPDEPDSGPTNDGGAGFGGGSGPGLSGTQGDPCTSPAECASGYACYSSDGTPEAGRCVALCGATSACARDLVCSPLGETSVCLEPGDPPGSDGGCALAPSRAAHSPRAAWLIAVALGLALGRRAARG
jgi:V8-like Glu-specific endopeptidase